MSVAWGGLEEMLGGNPVLKRVTENKMKVIP